MRLIGPIALILIGIGLFVAYTDPTYQSIKTLQAQSGQYNYALTQSTQLRQVRDQLLSRRNTFSTDQIRSLERLLPDNVDNIRFIIDLNDIAARDSLQIQNVSLASGDTSQQTVGSGNSAIGSIDVSFSVTATYPQMLQFLNDLEHSLRLVDIESIKFTYGGTAQNNYSFSVRTYWLR